ncbi:dynein axonemal heavy chain 6 isoform X1 [Plodia interpunctella]|uniref:dynein axonemal heavy chain 6 isoform X1 n=2 Tax=Plodia interpunctella TaxID=58824 RepID=UPI002367FC36|nr:dynein axonemal heavy chain 6 isoform X1 [Plodia interpunctella]
MHPGDQRRRSPATILPAIETLQRNVRKAPTYYSRKSRDIPFHLPHKKLLAKIEFVKEKPEPLTGFDGAQQDRFRREKKDYEPVKAEEAPVQKKKRIQIKIREPRRESSEQKIEYVTTDPLKVKPEVASQKEVIDFVRKHPSCGFLYMIYAVHPENVYFTPYYLNVVPYEGIDRKNYLTISPCGVTHYTNEMVFTKLPDWEQEYTIFVKLTDIKFFKVYRYWKAFYVWRKSILFRKYSKIRAKIAKNLFILTPVLGKALLSVQAMCCEMYMKTFADLSRDMDTAFFYFIEVQMKRVEYIREKLSEFRTVVLDIVTQACHTALYQQGFVYDDRNIPPFQIIRGKPTGGMSYTEKANKRKYCERLAAFTKLIDYMTNYMLYRLTKRSNSMMANMLRKHVEYTPDMKLLEGTEVDEVLEVVPRPIETCKWALFQVDAYVQVNGQVELNPSQKVMMTYLERITNYWDQYVRTFHNFLNEESLQIFVQPTIMGKQVEWSAGVSPNLYFLMNQDKQMLDDIAFIPFSIQNAYDCVWVFLRRMNDFMDNFREAHEMNTDDIKQERDTVQFRFLCEKFNKQMNDIEDVVSYQPLGLIFLCLCPFQELFRPQPRRLFDVVTTTTPDIGRDCIDEILAGIDNITEDITKEPETAGELVAFNFMMDGLEGRVVFLEERLEYLRELYDLMGEFNIPIPPDDMTEYLGLSVALGTLRTNVDARLETRSKLAGLFASQIGKDIMDLMMDVNKLRDEVAAPWLYDEKSDMETVMETLNDLAEKLAACSAREKQIRDWQKIFKIPPARFEALDEAINDVKLRQSLWRSSREWMDLFHSWGDAPFNTLDMEEIQNTTIAYGKIFNQLDKGMPPNKILPRCKETIDIIKEKIPVMSYLRNPALKPRHWVKIEEILHTRFTPETQMTLHLFEELQAFQHAEELMEVAGQASSEAGLEALLKKVEEMWAALEFPVLLHKDARDVYVLGGLEEIQAALDESNIHIGTILSSRNCGPIKSRVEEWAKNLDLFARTMEEWFACQQTWIYLEVIFSAPDIQRQLPNETRLFTIVDKSWKDIMRKLAKVPLAMPAATQPKLYEEFVRNNEMLDQIMKCLEAYLETKRVAFPRFFFLSNDELLEILAQTRNPHAVQPHLRKCFDAIAKLEFGVKLPESEMEITEDGTLVEKEMSFQTRDMLQAKLAKSAAPEDLTTDIIAMLSPEGERVNLGKGLKARGNVEDWLGKVEEAMFASVKRSMKHALKDYLLRPRVEWVELHPNQVVLTVSQIMWAKGVHEVFDLEIPLRVDTGLLDYLRKCIGDLNDLAALTRKDLTSLFRKVLCALITVDVHARDTIEKLVEKHVQRAIDFEWLKMIRYYWEEDLDNCVARMSSAMYIYGHEYLGAGGVLVITPLTDRCYLCLMGALQLDLGGAPAGPAGTGKTETTKDLAKSLAIQCVVFNCSEGLDYKMMGRFFSGLATSGAWCCFDEFNRIDIEVLSVIAQQLITIRNAKVAKQTRFMFEGREIKLVRTCAAFITMNPGYAGRTELPDNLKALFRPISMMVPDYALIAEVILYSEGFESSKGLAKKMVQMYKLSSEQLSKQDHYDFGMRAVKSVLVMAGALKRASPDQHEEKTLLCALNDSNLPKFLAADAILFGGILSDLFPGVDLPFRDYGVMEDVIRTILLETKKQIEACQIRKVIQLHETMIVRWGVMLVGPTGGGKTVVLHTLGDTYTRLCENGVPGVQYQIVHKYIMNPKSLSIGELYGEVNLQTLEWHDGILPLSLRTAVQCEKTDHQWLICDGPVDAVWIENMNTVLDDNKMLCLSNSERIKLTPYVHMVFEVADLAQASPATVSRCGMVYIDPHEMGYLPYVRSWLEEGVEKNLFTQENSDFIYELFQMLDKGIIFVNTKCIVGIKQVDISKVSAICYLMGALLSEPGERFPDKAAVKTYIAHCFIFCYVWCIGGNIIEANRKPFEEVIKRQFEEYEEAEYFPQGFNFFDMFMDTKQRKLKVWAEIIPDFLYDCNRPFFETLVPTIDTVRYGYLFDKLLGSGKPVMFTGNTGVGKTCIAAEVLNRMSATGYYIPVILNFSAQTSSSRTQEVIELRLDKRPRKAIGAPLGKKVIIFIDDVNMPRLDVYGAQPTIELLRQFLDFGGVYDRDKLYWKEILDVVLSCACAPPGGGRNPLTARFVRHFAMFYISAPSSDAMKTIFKAILGGHLEDFVTEVSVLGDPIVNASVDVYLKICAELLPTPAKSHYVFNLRDLSKTMQGVLQANAAYMRAPQGMLRLFYHECLRVFHDRLINVQDKSYFYKLMSTVCGKHFQQPILEIPDEPIIEHPPLLMFGDFINSSIPKENRIYQEIPDINKLMIVLKEYLEEYNSTSRSEMHLVLFQDCVEHVVRVARVLRAERGHCLMVGPGGSGRRSVATLAGHVNECKCMGMELKRNYDTPEFHDDLRNMYMRAGVNYEDTVFLFTDTQITKEEFLEDINNMLNSGEVPNLFEGDSYEQVQTGCRNEAGKSGINPADRDAVYYFFINRVRGKLHLCICMSPVGEAFRRRCRMFPSLVNCCTIDWFTKWPPEALLSVAEQCLQPLGDKSLIQKISPLCVTMHSDVDLMTDRLYNEMRRYFYTTPSSYLALLTLYLDLLDKKQQQIIRGRDRISCGLQKLYETYEVVGVMEQQVRDMEPILARKAEEGIALVNRLKVEQKAADLVKQAVMKDEAEAKVKAEEVKAIADEAKADLALAMPAMDAAQQALKALNKADINELKAFQKPPALVRFVMEPICILFGAKPDWDNTKKLLADVNFIGKLEEYDKDHIPDAILKKIKVYLVHKDFNPETVVKVSKVCRSMVLWVQAIDMYAKVFRIVEPKIIAHKEAASTLKGVMAVLRAKQKEVEAIEAQLAKMLDELRVVEEERVKLQADVDLAAARLSRAGKLTQALADEQTRWEDSVANATHQLYCTTGDIIVASGCIAYFGAFPSAFRRELEVKWINQCKELEIPASDSFDLIAIMADSYTVRQWNSQGLPRDAVSTENGILVTRAGRWPLTIDPQEQANRWIKNMERDHGLMITKLNDPTYLRVLENCIRLGWPMLIEDLGETLEATLAPVLLKQTFLQAGRLLIHLGDSDIEYDTNFRLYLTTKLANPHYLPEICIQVTLVNFTVTLSGLEDQLLADVVRLERPDLELLRTELIVRINTDKATLLEIEDKILRLLYASSGNILDDEELIETLNESKETSEIINARLEETEATEISISAAREKYRAVATRGAVLYFAVAQLADIDPMYQFSLKYFNQVFNLVIEKSEKCDVLETRLEILYREITLSVYRNVSRGLFERHKLVFSFLLNMAIYLDAGLVTPDQWNFILRGPAGTKVVPPKKPPIETLTDAIWLAANHLQETDPSFEGLVADCLKKIPITLGSFSVDIHVNQQEKGVPAINWNEKLTTFEKLMIIKSLKEEKLVFAIAQYVSISLGSVFIESPTVQLNTLYADTTNIIPLVFVLSTGSDPFGAFQKFASEMGMRERVRSISLGQGQGPVAEKMINTAKPKGDWVFLQNCHLAASWMLNLELIVANLGNEQSLPHIDFRLYLSSMPTPKFPVSVLQNSVKVTNEPPKGLKANVKRALIEMEEDFFENHVLGQDWRTMLFGICMFHAIIQERKKFGPLGWNITYEFNNSDRECAMLNLQMFCEDGHIPWDALEYITSSITYGGRVTDMWDQRCLTTILKLFFSPPILEEGYTYSKSGIYYCPVAEKLETYREYIETLPVIESPEVFGMHENANIAFENKETNTLIQTIVDVQPRSGGGGGGDTPDQIVWRICDQTRATVPHKIDKTLINPDLMIPNDAGQLHSLTTVLIHETDRFNTLLALIHSSLNELQKAIKGIVVMSEDFEAVFNAFLNNRVPAMWHKKGYNSLKSLGSWIHDLTLRVDFIEKWLVDKAQPSSWVSGLFFPQGLLTGSLQSYARRYRVPIDALMFDFTPIPFILSQEDIYKQNKKKAKDEGGDDVYGDLELPEDGVNIHGLFIDAGRWDMKNNCLVDALPGQMNPPLPVVWFRPVLELPKPDPRYEAPMYKTSERAGTLSTTGHSTNFVLPVLLPATEPSAYWIIRATALLTQITD